MAEEKIKAAPDVCAYVDDRHSRLAIEIAIPRVPKENINLGMHEGSFALSAPREDIENVIALWLYCPVRPEGAKAEYNNGLPRVEVPFKEPMEDAVG